MNKLDRLLVWAHSELQKAQTETVACVGVDWYERYLEGRCEALEEMIEQIQGLKENP